MLDRIWNRLSTLIPKSQAAYQGGRGTTEQVLALKMMVEKALTTNDFELYIILLDMSKAFDTVNRRILLTELEQVLNPDEMHILALLTNRPTIQIKLNEETSEEFQSYQGICQGDCLSAVLFIFYLARALKDEPIPSPNHSYIDPKYADDITYATTDKTHIPKIKAEIPEKLKDYNLEVNQNKTEEYEAPGTKHTPPPAPPSEPPENTIMWSELDWMLPPPTKPPEAKWKHCKLLGTKLGTEEDIKSRKSKAWEPMKKYNNIFKSKRISLDIKLRTFNTYVEPIVLYNSETWTMTSKLEQDIDTHQRKLLRIVINEKYHVEHEGEKTLYRTISNEKLYKITKTTRWSIKIRRRRLNLMGHILRLHDDTPAKKALKEATITQPKPRGRPLTTWTRNIMKDLQPTTDHHNISRELTPMTLKQLTILASDRVIWQNEIARSMGDKSPVKAY